MSRKSAPTVVRISSVPQVFQCHKYCDSQRFRRCLSDSTDCAVKNYMLRVSTDNATEQRLNNKHFRNLHELNEGIRQIHDGSWIAFDEPEQENNVDIIRDDNSQETRDFKTTEDVNEWFKSREISSITNINMDPIKSDVVAVDRYLGEELTHGFLEKDPDNLSIDIDLSDKKLSLCYDPILEELQHEKLLEVCGKDGFMMPEFQLDHLDPLTLGGNDMMVAGEILPSTSNQDSAGSMIINQNEYLNDEHKKSVTTVPDRIICDTKSAGSNEFDILTLSEQNRGSCLDENDAKSLGQFIKINLPVSSTQISEDLCSIIDRPEESITPIIQQDSKAKTKQKPRIVKEHRKVLKLGENNILYNDNHYQTENKDGIMAVVAISTDKLSNMTQIVINTGKEEQIYQGKTSELMEATGYFSKMPKINTTNNWTRTIENRKENSSISNHEMIITNALEELGYTEDNLLSNALPENGNTWVCPRPDCHREFNRLYALKGHLLAHHGVRPFKCDHEGCTWAFHSDFKLKRHKETHLKRKDYECQKEGCNRRFTTIYNLWTHEKLHTRPNRIACQVPGCQEKFQTKRALELHMKTHDQSHAPYVCSFEGCGKRYYSSNALTSHQRCHSYKEVDIKCYWLGCGKIFDKPCRLKAHLRCHTGSKPYLCKFPGCQWAFTSSSKLKRHEKKHTNERKFVCNFPGCSKAFMRSEHLKEHGLTHKEGRYFQCYMCDARFSAKSSLYVHMKKHQNRNNMDAQNLRSKSLNLSQQSSLEDTTSVNDLCNEFSIEIETEENENSLDNQLGCSDQLHVQNTPEELKFHDNLPDAESGGTNSVQLNSISGLSNEMIMVGDEQNTIPIPSSPDPSIPTSSTSLKNNLNKPVEFNRAKKNRGSARTGLTCSDVWKLKKKSTTTLNSVGPSDVVLGAGDLDGGFLLTEELPSMYYQDDIVGTECQILLLDSGTAETTIHLRDLE